VSSREEEREEDAMAKRALPTDDDDDVVSPYVPLCFSDSLVVENVCS
jgi:hypothetical protein